MKVRGSRECKDCGHRWSYYETGEVACPACGSLRSVGVDERTRHTDSPATLDLSEFRTRLEDDDIGAVAPDLKTALREYRRRRGFISGGSLRPLDDTFLASGELLHAVDTYARIRGPSEDEQLYVLDLLRAADLEERPPPDRVPPSMHAARGLGYAESLAAYRRDLATWLEDHPDPAARRTLGTLRERVKRVEALQGDVPPETVETLVRAARDLARYLRADDETALATASERLADG